MAVLKKEVEYAKEIDDCLVLFCEAVRNRKNKEDLTNLMDELMNALGGIDQVDDEVTLARKVAFQTIGYRTGELAEAFLPAQSIPL